MKIILSTWAMAAALLAGPAALGQNCRSSQFKGVYSALAKGEFLAGLPGPLLGPTTRIGRVEVDGQGNSKIQAITSLNGIVLAEEYQGVYTVNPDCTGRVTLYIPFPGVGIIPFTFNGVLSENLQQLDITLVNPPGSTVGLTLRQQNRSNCSAGDLSGGYMVSMRGFESGQAFTRLGRIGFDGKGGFSAETTVNSGGGISSDNFSGIYVVEPSCQFTMTYGANTWAGMLMDNSAGANLMVTGPAVPAGGFDYVGKVVSGTLKKQ